MKNCLLLGIILAASCSGGRQSKSERIQSAIEWADTIHHFGTISMDNPVDSFDFKFKNTGNQLLVVLDVKTSCHCTSVKYPLEPIKPNEVSYIRVIYNGSDRTPEFINKSVKVYTNAGTEPFTLKVYGKLE